LQDILDSADIRKIVASGGVVARLLYRGKSANEALLSKISREYKIDANIIFGNIVLFGNEPVGNLYVALSGESDRIQNAIEHIKVRGVLFERVTSSDERNG
jgi:D-methionine transport system ATP-binding protein